MRGKRACGFSFWSNTRLSHPDMAFASIYTRESTEFSTFMVVYDFSWAYTACGVFEVDGIKILVFCECLTSKNGLEI